MRTFKAFRIDSKDGRQIHAGFEDITLDHLTPGNVIIKSIYSGINYKDALAATGKGSILKKLPLVGGIDVVGTVDSSEDERFNVGDKVLICGSGLSETRDGAYAEYVRVPGDLVIPLPNGLSMFEVIAIGSAGFTAALAIYSLQLNGQSPELGSIVVTGATGGVGSYAIDLLSGLDYEVIAISGKPERTPYLESLGAAKVLSRHDLNLGERPLEKGLWGGAVDCVGGKLLSWLTRSVKPLGNIAVVGLMGGIEVSTTVMPFILRGVSLLGINSVVCAEKHKVSIWKHLASDFKPRHIDKIVSAEIPFAHLPEMFEAYIQGRVTGRVVIKIAD